MLRNRNRREHLQRSAVPNLARCGAEFDVLSRPHGETLVGFALLIPFFAGLRIEARYLTPGGYRRYSCCSNP